MSLPAVVLKLRALLDPNTGAVIQKNPRSVAPNAIALVVLQVLVAALRIADFAVIKAHASAAAAPLLHDAFRGLSR